MNLSRRKFLHIATGAAAAVPLSRAAWAQTYPTRSVRVIVPYAPGGQTDAIGRIFAQQLSERLGQQFYVENVPGAGGNIGVARAAKAAPDGYTVLVTDGLSLAVNPTLYGNLPYDPFKDLQPVALAVITTQVLTVNPSLPVHTVKELVRLIKSNAGKYSYASPGIGTPGHLAGELFRDSAGLDLVHVPSAAPPAAPSNELSVSPCSQARGEAALHSRANCWQSSPFSFCFAPNSLRLSISASIA